MPNPKKIILLLALLVHGIPLLAQETFQQALTDLSATFNRYQELGVGQLMMIPLTESGLTQKEVQQLQAHPSAPHWFSVAGDSVEHYCLKGHYEHKLLRQIEAALTHPEFDLDQFEEAFEELDAVAIVSTDRQMVHVSFNEQTGGSFRSRTALFHHIGRKEPPTVRHGSNGFGGIYPIESKSGIQYLMTGYARTCTSCHEDIVELVQWADTGMITNFQFVAASRNWDITTTYDSMAQTVSLLYEVSDLATSCLCNNEDDPYSEDGTWDPDREASQWCSCTFGLVDSTFGLIGQDDRWVVNQRVSGDEVWVTGTAINTKMGAVVTAANGDNYLLEGHQRWDRKSKGKTVKVGGQLKVAFTPNSALRDEKGAYSQGSSGYQWLLGKPVWQLVDSQ